MSKNQFWENLAQMYHTSQNAQMAPPLQQNTGAVQHLEEGGEVGGSTEDWSSIMPQSAPSRPSAPASSSGWEQSQSGPRDMGSQNPGGPSAAPSPWWMDAAKGFAGQVGPAAGQAATGMLINKMFPGNPTKARLLDLRQPEMQQGATQASQSLSNLQRNPNSFGLPGDPNDVNTPAGQRMYQLRKNSRSASAAAGQLETGGGAQRETDAVNRAIADSYNTTQKEGFANLASMTPQLQPQSRWNQIGGETNPWAGILTQALAPGVGGGIKAALGDWGVTEEQKKKKAETT